MMKKLILSLLVISCFLSCKKASQQNNENELLYKQLRYVCDSMIDHSHVTGMVAGIWAPGKGISFVYTAGLANLETGESMDKNMHFRIGSNTKTVTVTRFLQLVDSGYVSLQDKLSKFFPDFPKSDKITLEMLTDMTSGIWSYSQTDAFQQQMSNDPSRVWTMDELIDFSRDQPFHFEPGDSIDYCNTNTLLIGRIIEMITGDKLENQIQKYIIEPLHLKNTYYLSSGINMTDPHPKGYFGGVYDESYPEYSEYFDISWAQAAGSMISTLNDLKVYVEALNNGSFLPDSLQQIRRAKKIFFRPPDVYYSIGGAWFGDYYGHDGGLPGFTSTMVHSNEKNCTIIVWFNSDLDEDGECTDHIFYRFNDIVFK